MSPSRGDKLPVAGAAGPGPAAAAAGSVRDGDSGDRTGAPAPVRSAPATGTPRQR
ncbi:hypothetical protein SCATT_35100 [Streptantibioticus cattleyicolor NRRL 8057 = DSM 46488]|uniref:Uncharacterized protein n=1 Tax=Streptantibioticus cattleyicolor (strain ATCC 35852 / DSM 46488 / JCM 4925 / NBRC 14057 / NRRL 8057) TaxID=1003195 RepID=G8WUJ2_STREN|nr:hypothetical protein SCATT_35100 [Streptantibioticus cattleyicolor NRRL 8057 = DSM 46488]